MNELSPKIAAVAAAMDETPPDVIPVTATDELPLSLDAEIVIRHDASLPPPSPLDIIAPADDNKDAPIVTTLSFASPASDASVPTSSSSGGESDTIEQLVDDYGFYYQPSMKADEDMALHFNLISNMKKHRRMESKWLSVFDKWERTSVVSSLDSKQLRDVCRMGIPDSVRAKAWQILAGSQALVKDGVYEELLSRPAMPIYEVIERDIHRCYPDHFLKTDSQGQLDLHNILKAYAQYNPAVGYCQGMGRLVGMMLMQMPAQDSFWLLVGTLEKYLSGYYSPDLERLRKHAMIFEWLLEKYFSKLAKHLSRNDVDPLVYMTNWFLTVFTMTLPWSSVLRVWDMFYCDGVKTMFRVGLAIMSLVQKHLLKECPSSTEILTFLLHIPHTYLQQDALVKAALKIKLGTREVEELEERVDRVWQQQGAPTRGTLSLSRPAKIDRGRRRN